VAFPRDNRTQIGSLPIKHEPELSDVVIDAGRYIPYPQNGTYSSKGTGVSLVSVFASELVSEFGSTKDMRIASTELYSWAIVGLNRAVGWPIQALFWLEWGIL